ncbi:MAG: peptidoglycan-binding protein, partial [Bacteroidota bacterium]
DGFERVFEEGVASVIESMKTSRFLALHRTLPIGTNLKVRNLMNNQVVHVKVVGKLPSTGLNKNLLLRLSQPAYDQLGILDSKSRVEVSYSK